MDTVNLNQLTVGEGGVYLLGEVPFPASPSRPFPTATWQRRWLSCTAVRTASPAAGIPTANQALSETPGRLAQFA